MKQYIIFLVFAALSTLAFAAPAVDTGYDLAIDEVLYEGDNNDDWVTDPNSEIENRDADEAEYYDPAEYEFWNTGSWFARHKFLAFLFTFLGIGLIWFVVKPVEGDNIFIRLFGNFFLRTYYILPMAIVAFGIEYVIFMGWSRFFNDMIDTILGLVGLVVVGGFLYWGLAKGGFKSTGGSSRGRRGSGDSGSSGGGHGSCSNCRYNVGGTPNMCSLHGTTTRSSGCSDHQS